MTKHDVPGPWILGDAAVREIKREAWDEGYKAALSDLAQASGAREVNPYTEPVRIFTSGS